MPEISFGIPDLTEQERILSTIGALFIRLIRYDFRLSQSMSRVVMKVLIVLIKSVALIAAIAFFYGVFFLQQDGHPDSHLDLSIKAQAEPSAPFQAGFAAIDITPEVADRWYDANGDSQYVADDGDSYDDLNGNGVFDAVWMAGFSQRRAANGVHDALWARTAIFDDGQTRLAIVSLDVVGLLHEDVLDIRQALPASLPGR